MANEGTASVKIVGDVRDFARQVETDLNRELKKIKLDPVTVPIDSNAIRESGRQAGSDFGDSFQSGADETLRNNREHFARAGEQAGDAAGDRAGKSFARRFGDRVKSGFVNAAQATAKGLTSALGSALTAAGSAVVPIVSAVATLVGGTFIAVLGAVLLPAILGIVSAAVIALGGISIGLGAIGLAAFALREVEPLKKAFKDLSKTFKDVAKEAAKPLLKPLVNAMGGIQELIRQLRPEWTSIFKGLAPSVEVVTDALGGFAGALSRGIRDSLPGINAAIEGFARGFEWAGEVLGDFFREIFSNEDLIDNTTEALMKLIFGPLKLLGPLISGLNVVFGVWNNALRLLAETNVFGQLFDQIIAFVDGGTGAIDRIKEAWGPLGEAIQNVWDKLKAFAAEDDAGKLATRFQEVVQAIKDAWGPLKDFIGVVWDEAIAFVQRIWEEKFIPWWDGTAKPWLEQAFREAFEMAWNAAVSVTNERLGSLANTVLLGHQRIVANIRAGLAGAPGAARQAFTAAHTAVLQALSNIAIAAANGARTVINRLRSGLQGAHSAVIGAFAGAAGWLVSAGSNIINGLLSGIRRGFDRVRGLLGELTSMLPSWKGPEALDRVILRNSGRLVMQGFERGLLDQRAAIRSTLSGITGDLPGWTAGGSRSAAASTSTFTIMPGAIVINGSGADAGNRAAEAIFARLAQAGLVR